MVGILTASREERIKAIASHFIKSEIDDETLDLIKGATPEQKAKVKTTMDEWKHGKLKSGSKHGPQVTSQRQAIAIALNQAGLSKGVKKCMHGNTIGECEKCGDTLKKDDISMDGADDAGGGDDVSEGIKKGGAGSGRYKIGQTVHHEGKKYKAGKYDPETKLRYLHNHETGEHEEGRNSEPMQVHESRLRSDNEKDKVNKAFEDLLSKGGPGSGRKIGSTKSGKPIYDTFDHSAHKNFSSKDHLDAERAHRKKMNESEDKETKQHHKDQAFEHNTAYDNAIYEKQKQRGGGMKNDSRPAQETNKQKKNKYLGKSEDAVEKSFEDILQKGGKGSNKAGRVIGHTRSGKPINVFKEAADYKDFDAVDHLEAHKHHLNHSAKVHGVASVNSRIRAHDHSDQAQIKAALQEKEELEQSNAENKKKIESTGKLKPKAKPKAKPKSKVEKAFEDVLQKGDISSSFVNGYGGGDSMKFSKSGKEIISKLKTLKTQLEILETEFEISMSGLEDSIGEEPDDVNNSYNIKKLKTPRYSWDYYYKNPSIVSTETVVDGNMKTPPTVEQNLRKLCEQYNTYSSKLLSAKEDIESIRILVDNLEPGKKYNLSVSQLDILGF